MNPGGNAMDNCPDAQNLDVLNQILEWGPKIDLIGTVGLARQDERAI